MDCKRRRHYPNELKKEIIQKVKDGIKRSDIQKEYGIASSTLSKWICPPEKMIDNDESVRQLPIQPTPKEDKYVDENEDEDEDEDGDGDEDEDEDEDEDQDQDQDHDQVED